MRELEGEVQQALSKGQVGKALVALRLHSACTQTAVRRGQGPRLCTCQKTNCAPMAGVQQVLLSYG